MRKLSALFVSLFIFAMQLCADGSTYLNFTAVNGPAKVRLYRKDSCATIELQYSLDNCRTWSDYTINQDIQLSSGATVFFKAKDFNSTFNSKVSFGSPNCYFRFKGMVAADGNIMSLLDASMTLTSVPQYAFQYLFYGCTTLTQAPALPATNLAEGCYYGMFSGCTSLTQAPALPAMNLAEECYSSMFHNCTSLTQAPALPAMNLAVQCYYGMFDACTSLIVNSNPPGKEWQIPGNATPAADWNGGMFANTGGTFTGGPEIGVTYYIASDPTTEMEYVDVADYIVYANDGRIFVTGAGEATVSIYDVNGRMVATSGDASEPHELNVNAAGVYFVRIDDREPVKVVVR